MANWFTKLFKHGKNKDPAVGIEEYPEYSSYADIPSFDINPDGTFKFDKYLQSEIYSLTIARTCIHKIATEVSKATPQLAKPNKRLDYFICKYPNQYQSSSQFLYQLATILLTDNNCYIIPIFDEYGKVGGLWLSDVHNAQIVQIKGELWLEYDMHDGKKQYCQYSKVGHLKRMQYTKPFSGESNYPFNKIGVLYEKAMDSAMTSLDSNDDKVKWLGQLNAALGTTEQIAEQRKNLAEANRGNEDIYMVDGRFIKFEQIKKQFNLLKAEDMETIQKEACNYWGVSENVLQNKYSESEWYAFYQSAVEPLLLQIGQAMTRIVYSVNQIIDGNEISLNSLQYSSVKSRIEVAFGVYDRGMASMNDSLAILNLPPLPGEDGEKRYIRGEYYQEGAGKETVNGTEKEPGRPTESEDGEQENRE